MMDIIPRMVGRIRHEKIKQIHKNTQTEWSRPE